jgi:hypothetical protein
VGEILLHLGPSTRLLAMGSPVVFLQSLLCFSPAGQFFVLRDHVSLLLASSLYCATLHHLSALRLHPYILQYSGLPYSSQGHAVAHLVEALRYKLKGRGFNSRWCHLKFLLTQSFRPHYGPAVD